MTWLLSLVRAPFWRIVALVVFILAIAMSVAAAAPSPAPSISSILTPLAVVASSAIGTFVVAVLVDDVVGILVAIKAKRFDPHQLPSFLESEFGTKQALALAGLVATAVSAAAGAAILKGGLNQQALQAIADAAFAAASAGAAALLLSVVTDIKDKVSQLFGAEPPAVIPSAR